MNTNLYRASISFDSTNNDLPEHILNLNTSSDIKSFKNIVFNSWVNMLILESILEFYKKKTDDSFKALPQWTRKKFFNRGFFDKDTILQLSNDTQISSDYFTGNVRFYIPELEGAISEQQLNIKKGSTTHLTLKNISSYIVKEYRQSTIPSTLVSDYVRIVCEAYVRNDILADTNLIKLIHYVGNNGDMTKYSPYDEITKRLNFFNFHYYKNSNTKNLAHYVYTLKEHYELASAVLQYKEKEDEFYCRMWHTDPNSNLADYYPKYYKNFSEYITALSSPSEAIKGQVETFLKNLSNQQSLIETSIDDFLYSLNEDIEKIISKIVIQELEHIKNNNQTLETGNLET